MRRRVFILVLALVVALSLAAGVMRARAAAVGPAAKPTIKVIVMLKSGGNASEVARKLQARNSTGVVRYHIIPAISATVSQDTIAALRADGNVLQVFNDHKIPAPKMPTGVEGKARTAKTAAGRTAGKVAAGAPLESEALQLTHAQDAWSIKVNGQQVMGQGVRIGMLDSGTDPLQPDLAPAIEAYKDFTGEGLYDDVGHGTGTSSTVAAQGLPVFNPNTNTTMNFSGMAPKSKVLMAKVIGEYNGWDSQIIRGIQWLMDQKVDIISCSLGALAIPQDGKDPGALAAQAAVDAGITFVNSEGNEGPGQGTMGSSPDAPGLLAVGASTGNREFAQEGFMGVTTYRGDQVITWSSRGPNSLGDFRPDIMGFGAYGWALAPVGGSDEGQNIQEFGGTSMAAPVVAGDLALAESAWKLSHPGEALPAPLYWKKLLASTTTNLGYPALEQSSGLVNAKAAVMAVLKRGTSMLVSVEADNTRPSSWSASVAGGAKASTRIVVSNSGDAKEKITLSPTTYVADASQTITRSITLNGPDFLDDESFTVPSGTDFVQTTVTWPSGPDVSIRSAVYDSDGNFLTYAPTYGGYGHLTQCQIALKGPKDQRPVVKAGTPWKLAIFPRGGMYPADPTQQINVKIEFMHKATWSSLKVAMKSFTLKTGASREVQATITAPAAAGTYFGGVRVSNGSATTTIPVSIRVPVKMTNGQGTFSGKLVGSTVEYFGGEFYFYDFTVPSGTASLAAAVTWPDQGNLVSVYLVDPNGRVRDAKSGDLNVPDYASGTAPDAALTHTGEQVLWNAPMTGKWQVLIWAPGFSGNGFSEPYTGTITLDHAVVSPTAWTATAAPGQTVIASFSVANLGPTDLAAYADSQVTYEGVAQYQQVWDDTNTTGNLFADDIANGGGSAALGFYVPQNCTQLTAYATWGEPYPSTTTRSGTGASVPSIPIPSASPVLVDLGLYDPAGTDAAESLATSDQGNAVQVQNPMSGLWTTTVAYGDPGPDMPDLGYAIQWMFTAPIGIDDFAASSDVSTPLTVVPASAGTITASITVPADAAPGDTVTGTIDFYTATGDQMQAAGGDHLGSVPVTITVTAP